MAMQRKTTLRDTLTSDYTSIINYNNILPHADLPYYFDQDNKP
jgi:hypothetical protein